MRPLTLSLTAFGSFAGRLEIDFVRLARHGSFAITGPTGSGKSTIFDAMVFALYDALPGSRVNANIRSQFADPALHTEVTFSFEVHGEQYWVRRKPRQLVGRSKGQGELVEKPSVHEFGRVGADVAEQARLREVNARIEELLGLSREQFEQVVLIPQGKFEQVLKAGTTDRSTLLKRLFPVSIFEAVTDQLKLTVDERRQHFERASEDSAELLASVRAAARQVIAELPPPLVAEIAAGGDVLDDEQLDALGPNGIAEVASAIDALVTRASAEAALIAERRQAADTAVADAEALLASFAVHERNLELAADFPDEQAADREIEVSLDRAVMVAPLIETIAQWVDARSEVERLEAELAALILEVRELEFSRDERSELDSDVQALATRVDEEATELERAAEEHLRLCDELSELADEERAVAKVASDLELRRGLLDELRQRQRGAEAELVMFASQSAGLDAAERRCEEIAEKIAALDRRAALQGRIEGLRAAEVDALARETAARDRAADIFETWSSQSAGRLAARLVDGAPCSVCGSTEHPAPATRASSSVLDDAALERADAEVSEARVATQAASTARATAEGILMAGGGEGDRLAAALEQEQAAAGLALAQAAAAREGELRQSILERETSISDEAGEIEATALAQAARGGGLLRRRELAEQARDDYVAAQGSFESTASRAGARRAAAVLLATLATHEAQTAVARRALDSLERSLAPTLASLRADSPAQLLACVLDADELHRRRAELTERRDRRQAIQAGIAAFLDELTPAEKPELEPLLAARSDARAAESASAGRMRVLADQQATIAAVPASLAAFSAELDRSRRSLEEAQTLHSLCAGSGAASVVTRLSLENWVLMDYLRHVLKQANVRLSTMTQGRYSLEIDELGADGRRAFGLDLAVFDSNTGRSRPATTLSGGETFMAALSLALGLADVVGAGSNRVMGALFVDEGFGSLDPESLDAVLEVLRSLEDGGRMVGVISHVEELKASLPAGITLASSRKGSIAQINYPSD